MNLNISDYSIITPLTITHKLLDGMHDPTDLINMLISGGMQELKIKYRSYGNSYLDTDQLNLAFWKKRLGNEIMEYKKCITPQERERKLYNLFNLTFMALYFELNNEKGLSK